MFLTYSTISSQYTTIGQLQPKSKMLLKGKRIRGFEVLLKPLESHVLFSFWCHFTANIPQKCDCVNIGGIKWDRARGRQRFSV